MPGMKKPAAKQAAKPMGYKRGGMTFKPCAKCPNPTKCRAAGKCMLQAKKS